MVDQTLSDVAAAFAERRAELGLTQEQAAERSGLSLRSWSTLEKTGGVRPATWRLAAVGLDWPLNAAELLRDGDSPGSLAAVVTRAGEAVSREAALASVEGLLLGAGLAPGTVHHLLVLVDHAFDLE